MGGFILIWAARLKFLQMVVHGFFSSSKSFEEMADTLRACLITVFVFLFPREKR